MENDLSFKEIIKRGVLTTSQKLYELYIYVDDTVLLFQVNIREQVKATG